MGMEFRRGEKLWLSGEQVVFVEHHANRIGGAVVRRPNATSARVVPVWKLARDRPESIARANAVPTSADWL